MAKWTTGAILFLTYLSVAAAGCNADPPMLDLPPDEEFGRDSYDIVRADGVGLSERSSRARRLLHFMNRELADDGAAEVFEAQLSTVIHPWSAHEIIMYRVGNDALVGTSDDREFGSLSEFDRVPYVGEFAIYALSAYVESITPETNCAIALGQPAVLDFMIVSASMLDAIKRTGCTEFPGNLTVRSDQSASAPTLEATIDALSKLQHVEGNLVLDFESPTSSSPANSADNKDSRSSFDTSVEPLSGASLDELRSIGGRFVTLGISQIKLPRLKVAEEILLSTMRVAEMPALTVVASLDASGVTERLELSSLEAAGALTLNCSALSRIESLTSVDSLTFESHQIDAACTKIAAPALRELGDLRFAFSTTKDATLHAPHVQEIRSFSSFNANLDGLELPLREVHGNVLVSNRQSRGLPSLAKIGGDLIFPNGLAQHDGLQSLVVIGGDIAVESRNSEMSEVHRLVSQLEFLGGQRRDME